MWKNLKSYFIVEEEGKPGTPSSAKKPKGNPAKPTPASPKASPTAPASSPSSVSGNVNDRFVKVLMEAMEAANLPGFDYLEYKKSLQNLKKMNFTDSVRYQTAFATAQSMGVTPQQLQDSAQHYLTTLNTEQKKFSNALAGQRAQQINEKEGQLKQMDADIGHQEAKIKELQAQIEQSKKQQEKLRKTIKESVDKLAKTQADFETTFKIITEGIEQDKVYMAEFLK
ncbi:FtsB/FtsL family cell division protein [Neolewinella persica]|uniref:hypothetical protein n=1 Tax=Neolewinella persica TaxID=70998 RepID=UPI0003A433AE|nr:hypothetical protein [Neolewinella persica]